VEVEFALAMDESIARWTARPKQRAALQSNPDQTWTPPKQGIRRLNIDGCHPVGTEEGAIACACRDSSDFLIEGFTRLVKGRRQLLKRNYTHITLI